MKILFLFLNGVQIIFANKITNAIKAANEQKDKSRSPQEKKMKSNHCQV